MKKNIFHRQNWRELAAYGALWLILFLLPIFTEWVNARITPDKIFHWNGVFHLWLSILNLFIVFVIHNFFIAPIFVYHRKRWIYYPLAIALIGLYMSLIYTYRPELPPPPPKNQSQTEMQAVSPLEIHTKFEATHKNLLHGQALHAGELHFVHPRTGKEMTFTAEPPKEFCELEKMLFE